MGLRLAEFVAQRTVPARTSEGGKWRRVAGWQVAGGAAPLPVGRRPWSLPRGGCTNLPAEAPGTASPAGHCLADPGLPSLLSVLQPGLSPPSPRGWRGAGPDRGALPPITGHQPFLILPLILAPNKTG